MNFLQVITFVLLTSTASRGCPTKQKPLNVIEGSGDTYDHERHRSITINPDGYPTTTEGLGSVTGWRLGDSGRALDKATMKQDVYPPRAQKIDLDNKSDEEGRNDYGAAEKQPGIGKQRFFLGGSDSLLTASENDRRPQTHFVLDTVSQLELNRSSQSFSVPSSLPDLSRDGSVFPERPEGQELGAQTRNPVQDLPDLPTDGPPDSSSQLEPIHHHEPLPSRLPDLLAAEPTSPAELVPDFQQTESSRSTAPAFVAQDPSASLNIMQGLPPELLMYLKTLRTSVESHLLEEFQSIGFSMGPNGEGRQMSHPKYRIICSLGDVEVRSYRRSTWISTTVHTSSFDVATYIGFHRLFRYIKGENTRGTQLDMAKPVRTQVLSDPTGRGMKEHLVGEEGRTRYTVSFYASRKRAVDFPTPLDRRIFIEELRPSRFYALAFSGFPISTRVHEQAHGLARLLPNSDRNLSGQLGSSFFVDVYDTPMKLTDRHNEILIPLESDDSPRRWCSNPGPTAESPE